MKQLSRFIVSLFFGLILLSGRALAAPPYDRDAVFMDSAHPGVYKATAMPGDSNATLGISGIAKQNLEKHPTTQSPAIIMGAAVPYEKKTGPAEFTPISGGSLYAPYSYFRYEIMEEQGQDGTTHRKLSGFDGSYVIIRVDVSKLIQGAPAGSFLHVKQEGNAALMVTLGQGGSNGAATFSDAGGNKSGVYPLADNAASLKDTDGTQKDTPYLDVILMSSGTLVAGADTGTTDPTQITADFKLKFYVDQTGDYRPDLVEYTPGGATTTPTLEEQWLAKYYDETKMPSGTSVTSYLVKGSDLELEVVNDDGPRASKPEYWSLRKALAYETYNNSPIKMICEVPVLEGLQIDGTGYSGDRKVIFDVNRFDIQIANHQETGAAALTIKNAALTLKDGFNTTGAELAVGNNAQMTILEGGTLIIDQTCQLEVEYDAASTTPPSGQDPAPAPKDLDRGIITVENGGEIINNGVLTIEGTEGKPIDPATPTIRDKKDAILIIRDGGKLTNNGCLLSYGELYCMGTIVNNGAYDDVIESKDPDKGNFTYHRGIQISWKDDVTQDSVYMGHLYIGEDPDGAHNNGALLENHGDIVMVPGILECHGKLNNANDGSVYLCPVEEAIIPIKATVDQPYIREKRVRFGTPMKSYFTIHDGGNLQNKGALRAAGVEIVSNGRTGRLTPLDPSDRLFADLSMDNQGTASNDGTIVLDGVYTFGKMTNTGSIETKVVVSSNTEREGILYDKAAAKLTEVYNASLTKDGDTNIWSHSVCSALSVLPPNQSCKGGDTPSWTVTAKTDAPGDNLRYWIDVIPGDASEPVLVLQVAANEETAVTGPVLPETNANIVYGFYVLDGTNGAYALATVNVSSDHETPPAAIADLVYNGKEQVLVTTGGANGGKLEYKLGNDGAWSDTVPAAKNAGTYTVYYRLAGNTEAEGSAEVVIARRPVTVSCVDVSSQAGAGLKEPDYTVSGIVEGETLAGVRIFQNVDNTKPGTYPITVKVEGENPNYEVTVYPGTYTVTRGNLSVTAKDKYGVFSDELTYKGFNIELSVLPSNVAPYYSLTQELTDDNYNTAGYTAVDLPDLPAGAGTHLVYYYVTDGTDVIRGSKRVIIEKAQQKAPANLITRAESYKNSGDGIISGLVPREMEYRRADNDGTYTVIYMEKIYVVPGIYLVRRAGDNNHYPSPDCAVVVEEGNSITVSFDSNGGSEVEAVEGLACGDLVPCPPDPSWRDHKFLGWFYGDELFDFETPVTMDIYLTAHWEEVPVHVHSLKLVEAAEAACTRNGNSEYYICTSCSLWFEDATGLVEITDKSSVIIKALGHKWDKGTVTKEPTETEEGIRTYTCLRDSSHTKEVAIPVTGHTHSLTKMEAVRATCTDEGNISYYVCSGCGLLFKDASAKTQITDKNSVVLKPLGHQWDDGVVTKAPTATRDGIRTYTCLRDSSHTKTEVIPARGRRGSDSGRDSDRDSDSSSSSNEGSGAWSKDNAGWHYSENGMPVKAVWRYLPYNGLHYWYYFDEDGLMKTGWLDWNGSRYYLWAVSDGWMGRMLTGWQQIEGKWYYFETVSGKNQGHMYRSEQTPDGYYVDTEGVWDGNPAKTGDQVQAGTQAGTDR